MQRRRRIFQELTVVAVVLVSTAAGCGRQGEAQSQGGETSTNTSALVPPPPVNQYLGFVDTTIANFTPITCLNCHKTTPATTNTPNTVCTDPTAICEPVADRHHAALETNPELDCTTCHTPDDTLPSGMTVTVDCLTCHTTSPHHSTPSAVARHCADCHGSVVTNFDDGHYIPTYAASMVTPGTGDSQCKVDKAGTKLKPPGTSLNNCKAGSCTACHQSSSAVTPPIHTNAALHHGTGIGSNPGTDCTWCHDTHGGVLNVRTCETCHGMKALHNIQFAGNAATGPVSGPGYGHIGTAQDCWGCHGYFNKYALAPLQGATVPVLDSIDTTTLTAGTSATLTVSGANFTNTVTYASGAKTFTPVLLLGLDGQAGSAVAITPTSFTDTSLVAEAPATLAAGNWTVYVVKDYQGAKEVRSNKATLAVESPDVEAAIEACKNATGATLTPTGCVPKTPAP